MLRLIYIIGTYPLVTTTFIDREITILRRLGVDLRVVAIRRPDDAAPLSAEQRALQQGVHYLLPAALLPLLLSQIFFALFRPLRYFGTLRFLLTRPHATPHERLKTMLHFGEGVYAAFLLRDAAFDELHAHFVDRAATLALVIGRLLDRPYTLSIHAAADIFVRPVLLREKIAGARGAVTCTAFNRAHIEKLVGTELASRVACVYHGLDLAHYAPAGAARSDPPLIVSVGQLTARKGFPVLIRACRLLRDHGYIFRCEIVGRGPQHAELVAQIAELSLEDTVALRGALPHEEVIALYRRASIFALPCVRTPEGDVDGIPNVIAEAMAMEVPVVATAVSAIPELLEDGVNALLAPPDNAEWLAERIAWLLESPSLRATLGHNGRQSIMRRFDVEQNVRAFAATLWPEWFAPAMAHKSADGGGCGPFPAQAARPQAAERSLSSLAVAATPQQHAKEDQVEGHAFHTFPPYAGEEERKPDFTPEY